MNVVLVKKIALKSVMVYLRLQRKVKREDIQNYLQGKHFDNPIIENRVREYLRGIGIYNEQYCPTPYGNEVKENGMVKEDEEGKYQIWFTQSDFLFGNRIFYFKRIKPEQYNQHNQRLSLLELDFSGKTFLSLPIAGKDAQDSIEFSVKDEAKKYPAEMNINTTNISCIWTWNDTQTSFFKFSGNFETTPIDNSKPVDFKIDLEQHIPTIIPEWNTETNRCKLKIENIDSDDTYQYFKYSGNRPRDGYESCVFNKLPVEPYNHEEAIEWRDKIINMELAKKYMHPDDFVGTVNAINQKEGFPAYSDLLDIPDMSNYIEKLEPGKKSDRELAYWHLAAPLDLNIGIPKLLQIDSFSLSREQDGDISFRELAAKFGKIRADKIFYYDKYVYNCYQQRSVSAFLNSFDVSDICIVTEKNNPEHKFSDYLAENKPEIIVTDIFSVYQNPKDAPHDRFIVFKFGSDLLIWTSTNSIDFVRFNTREVTPDTSGVILKSVTFTKVKPDVLGTPLKEFILRG